MARQHIHPILLPSTPISRGGGGGLPVMDPRPHEPSPPPQILHPLSSRLEMDAATSSKKAKTSEVATTPQKPWNTAPSPADQILKPEKLTSQRVTATAAAEQIWTPEKLEERPRVRSRSVAFFLKDVCRTALGLRRPEKETLAAVAEAADELESVERELAHPTHLGVGSKERACKTKGRSPDEER